MDNDIMQNIDGATVQHGKVNDRIYLMKIGNAQPLALTGKLTALAKENNYSKIFAKIPKHAQKAFIDAGFEIEAEIPNFYNGNENAVFLGKYFSTHRKTVYDKQTVEKNISIAKDKANGNFKKLDDKFIIRKCEKADADQMSEVYKVVFKSYPFPIHDPQYLKETMDSHIKYFGIFKDDELIAVSSAEMDTKNSNVEMTDFATLPSFRGCGFAGNLLAEMEKEMITDNIKTGYTIARSYSAGMNITFARGGYQFGGTLINNTNISGSIECMNVWYKNLC